MTTALPGQLLRLPPDEAEELACRAHLGVWTARRRKLPMAPFLWEWCQLAMTESRLCVVAPREHGKSESFVVNATAWRSIYLPGTWTYVFSRTGELGEEKLDRIEAAVLDTDPWLARPARRRTKTDLILQNGSRVTSAGVSKAVRGAHPDYIVGDDVLTDDSTRTELQRKRTSFWWKGTVTNMAHPGAVRSVRTTPDAEPMRLTMPPTRIFLVGTPFHQQDLLSEMKNNALYTYRRYSAEYRTEDLVPGTWAVEVR